MSSFGDKTCAGAAISEAGRTGEPQVDLDPYGIHGIAVRPV